MFTETEIALGMRYTREVDELSRDAQRLIDSKNAEIARLRRQLSAALADNEALRRERAENVIADMHAFRAARKRAAH